MGIESRIYETLISEGIELHVAAEKAKRWAAELSQAKAVFTPNESTPTMRLPDKAPKLYAERERGQNIIDFLRDPKGWWPYIEAGVLTRADFRRLDPGGEMAVRNWLRTQTLPDDLKLPTRREINDQELQKGWIPPEHARRLGAAFARRRQGLKSSGPTA